MRVKICGLSTPETIASAMAARAAYVGFVFFEKSPRYVAPETAQALAAGVDPGVVKVALMVNPDDALLDVIAGLPIDMIQLHGAETPSRVRDVRARLGLPVMKAIGVADEGDLAKIDEYEAVADQLLIDAKPPKNGVLPGGNGLAFDWRLIANRQWSKPWMLAGGLDAGNVGEAIGLTGARQIDVSSGVESAPGVKSASLIAGFIAAANVA